MNTDKRFGKPLCSRILASDKQCGFPVYKDRVCKRHHADWQYGRDTEKENESEEAGELEIEIEKAIVLLVKNGYRVDKPN